MTGNPTARIPLVEFANHITKNRSLLMIGHIINYSLPTLARKRVMDSQYEWMHTRKIKAFYLLLESSSLYHGTKTMLQVSFIDTLRFCHIFSFCFARSLAWVENFRQTLWCWVNDSEGGDQMLMIALYRLQMQLETLSAWGFDWLLQHHYVSGQVIYCLGIMIDFSYAMEMSIGIGILRVQEGLDYADFFNLSTQQIGMKLFPPCRFLIYVFR